MTRVLLLSEDTDFATDLREQITLNLPGFEVLTQEDDEYFDIVVLDEQENKIKSFAKSPVVLLSSSQNKKPDCLVIYKPLRLSVFLDELQSAIQKYENGIDAVLSFRSYKLNPALKELLNTSTNESVKLTEKEVSILKYLYKVSPKVVSKTDLLKEVWEYNPEATTHTVETHIYRLRQKVEKDTSPPIIETTDGGYKLI